MFPICLPSDSTDSSSSTAFLRFVSAASAARRSEQAVALRRRSLGHAQGVLFFSQFHKGASRRRASPGSQFHGRAACAALRICRRVPAGLSSFQGRVVQSRGARYAAGMSCSSSRPVLGSLVAPSAAAVFELRNACPNTTLNRTRYGMPPWPQGARCSSCASRPGRHAFARRLAPR